MSNVRPDVAILSCPDVIAVVEVRLRMSEACNPVMP